MGNEQKSSNPNAIFDILNKINEEKTEKVWVPSLNKEIDLLPMTAFHQKKLVRASIDNPYFTTKLNITIFEILSELMDTDVKKLNIVDKAYLLLELRNRNIGSEYEVEYDENKKQIIDLGKHIKTIKKKIKFPKLDILKSDDLEIKVTIPSLETEYEFDKKSYRKVDSIDPTNQKNLKDVKEIITDMYISTMAQYVETISSGDVVYEVATLPVNNRIVLLEKLNNSIVEQIKKETTKISDLIEKITTVKFDNEQGEEQSGKIQLNETFFSS